MLEPLGSELWVAEGRIVSFLGLDYPTRMVVVRLEDGGLWVWSPVEPTPQIEAQIQALGPVRHLVSPNKLHHLFLPDWQRRFPDALVWGTASTIAKCRDITFAGALDDNPQPEWAGQIDQYYFANSRFLDELMFYHRASRFAIIADLSQAFSEGFLARHWPWWMRPIARFSGITQGWGYPPLDLRTSFRRHRTARPKVCALIDAHPEHVVVAHGEIVRTGGEAFMRRAFAWLL